MSGAVPPPAPISLADLQAPPAADDPAWLGKGKVEYIEYKMMLDSLEKGVKTAEPGMETATFKIEIIKINSKIAGLPLEAENARREEQRQLQSIINQQEMWAKKQKELADHQFASVVQQQSQVSDPRTAPSL